MDRCLTFALAGGGARGALQVGALRALIEAGYVPDLLVGTSIGAVNAAGLAVWGADRAGLAALEQAWEEAAATRLVDARFARLVMRGPFRGRNRRARRKVAEYFIARGITPDLRFADLTGPRLALVSADLNSGQTVIYGREPRRQSILEGIMASIALPPWLGPVEQGDRYLIDGGLLSNLPIEPALTMGATEIIALNLRDHPRAEKTGHDPDDLLAQCGFALHRRHIALEKALADAQGVPVHCIELVCPTETTIWDFSSYQNLIAAGYDMAQEQLPSLRDVAPTRPQAPQFIPGHFAASGQA